MSSIVIAAHDSVRLHRSARVRALFEGLDYALLLGLMMVLSGAIREHVNELPLITPLEALVRIGRSAVHYAISILPFLPLVILALNRAPRTLTRRIIWLVPPVLLVALWSALYDYPNVLTRYWAVDFFQSLLAAALLSSVCLYRSSMRGATDRLTRTRIDAATLDAEFNRARLRLLRAQIEPHFLFNTFANVRTLARIDRAAAVDLLDHLIHYFAAALPQLRGDDTSVAQELGLIDAYLGIHRARMGSRLTYEVILTPDLGTQRIPTMILLTLVENAIKHGIFPNVEGGFVRVSAARTGAKLVLTVADSGRGMSAQQGCGTGFANVRLRLLMRYGDAAVLSLTDAAPHGVVAAVSLPIEEAA